LESLELFDSVGMTALRAKSERLTAFLEDAIDELAEAFPDENIRIISPRDPAQRGCQLSFELGDQTRDFFETLIKEGVIVDFREPNIIRVAPVPLYNSFGDVATFSKVMHGLLEARR
ncbi:MAG: kynureninase, partial [Pseudomonadota bacterium]